MPELNRAYFQMSYNDFKNARLFSGTCTPRFIEMKYKYIKILVFK